jgi:hypothetical protein
MDRDPRGTVEAETQDDADLRAAMAVVRDPPGPFGGAEARAMAEARARRERGAAAVLGLGTVGALAATLLLALLPDGPPPGAIESALRARGAAPPEELQLDWLVEGETVRRGMEAAVEPGERVVFRARTAGAGYLCLDEFDGSGQEQRVHPPAGVPWHVEAGAWMTLRDGRPLGWRPDAGSPGLRRYRLRLDPERPDCSAAAAEVVREIEWR